MNDEEFESLPLEQRRRILELLEQDPTAEITDKDLEPEEHKPTPLQQESMRLLVQGRKYLESKGHHIEPYEWESDNDS